jgi:hypothetical protein
MSILSTTRGSKTAMATNDAGVVNTSIDFMTHLQSFLREMSTRTNTVVACRLIRCKQVMKTTRTGDAKIKTARWIGIFLLLVLITIFRKLDCTTT